MTDSLGGLRFHVNAARMHYCAQFEVKFRPRHFPCDVNNFPLESWFAGGADRQTLPPSLPSCLLLLRPSLSIVAMNPWS